MRVLSFEKSFLLTFVEFQQIPIFMGMTVEVIMAA